MTRFLSPLVAAMAAVAMLLIAGIADTPSASAHERRTVADKYTFVVGFNVEPVLLEQPNAALLRVSDAQTNAPVEGVEQTLKIEITNSGQTKTFDLTANRTTPGTYTAELIPTKSGQWIFRFTGSINGTTIDERFESGPGRFGEPQPLSALQFPVQLPSVGELAEQVQQGQGSGQAAEAAQPAGSSADVQRALDQADSARTMAIVIGGAGVLLGLAGLAVAFMAMRSRGGSSAAPRSAEPI